MIASLQPAVAAAGRSAGTNAPNGPRFRQRGQFFHIGEAQQLYDNYRNNNYNIGLWDGELQPFGRRRQGPRYPENDPHTPWTARRGALFAFGVLNFCSEIDALNWLMRAPPGSYIEMNIGTSQFEPAFPGSVGYGAMLHNAGRNEVKLSNAHLIYEAWWVYGWREHIRGVRAGPGQDGYVMGRGGAMQTDWRSILAAEMLIKSS